MGYFKELNQAINKTLEILLTSNDLCKLLYYNDTNPLSQSNVSDPSSLILSKIFPFPQIPESQEDVVSLINVYFSNMQPYSPNNGAKKELLTFDIMSHLNIWTIESALRPYAILEEIDLLFNNKYYNELSMKKIFFNNCQVLRWSNYFYGFQSIYELGNDSNMERR